MRKAENVKTFESLLRDLFNLKQKLLLAIHDPADVIIKVMVKVQSFE